MDFYLCFLYAEFRSLFYLAKRRKRHKRALFFLFFFLFLQCSSAVGCPTTPALYFRFFTFSVYIQWLMNPRLLRFPQLSLLFNILSAGVHSAQKPCKKWISPSMPTIPKFTPVNNINGYHSEVYMGTQHLRLALVKPNRLDVLYIRSQLRKNTSFHFPYYV